MRARPGVFLWALIAAILLPTLAAPAEAGKYRRGEFITIQGQVTSIDGAPLPGVTVLFEPSRRIFRLSKMFKPKHEREQTDRLQVPTTSDEQGNYSFEWRWDPYYNNFELAIAVPVQAAGQREYEILHRTDFTDRMKDGSPVAVGLEVQDPSRLSGSSRRWSPPIASSEPYRPPPYTAPGAPGSYGTPPPPKERRADRGQSEDEKRILEEMGSPDKIDTFERPSGTETSWWYFTNGKVYHFLDGELSQVTHFDPIPPASEG